MTNDANCICPICFKTHPIAMARAQYRECPDCGSEAIGVDLVPLSEYLAGHTLEALQEQREQWAIVTGFYESYKADKLKRIDHVIALKRRHG